MLMDLSAYIQNMKSGRKLVAPCEETAYYKIPKDVFPYKLRERREYGFRQETGRLKYYKKFVRFEVFTAVTIKNGVFLDVTPCGCPKNRRFGGT
jgi:hypothetical protein